MFKTPGSHGGHCPWQECRRRQKRNHLNCLSSCCNDWTCSKQFPAFQQRLRVPLVMDLEVSKQKNSLISGLESKWLLTVVISNFGSSTFSSLSKWKSKKKKKRRKKKPCLFLTSLLYRWQVIRLGISMNDCKYLNISSSSSCGELICLYPDLKLYLAGFWTVPCKAWK